MALQPDEVIKSLAAIGPESFQTIEERAQATVAAQALLDRLQSPWEKVYRLTWMNPALIGCLKVLVDVDLFGKWKVSGSGSKTSSELAALSGVEEALLVRLLRHMSAMNTLNEVARDTFSMTPFTESLASVNKSAFPLMYDATYPAFINLPSFLEKTGYKNPVDSPNSNWQDLHKSPQTYIQFVGSDKERTDNFQNLMVAFYQAKGLWVDTYPTEDLLQGLKPDRVVLVDCGGGKGSDIETFRAKHPHLPSGSLILQDLPEVVATVQANDAIKLMPHNLFETQPIKGARIYFTHIVFHTWSDEDAMKILKNFAEALEPGYSKLLLHEKVIQDEHPTPDVTSMDLTMMATFSSNERTQTKWTQLLTDAGLKINKVYKSPALYESIIEAEKA